MNNDTLTAVIKTIAKRFPAILPHLNEAALKATGYDGIRTVMSGSIFGAVFGYLSGEGNITQYRERMATAVSKAYLEAADVAYEEGGGELPLDEDTASWARGQLEAQFAFIDQLFDDLRELRKAGEFDAGEVATSRAEGYASALDGFFNEAKLRGAKNIVVTWNLGGTEKHCPTCKELDGQNHKISWFVDKNYIPRKYGAAMDCGGYNCDCSLTDRLGNEYTI